MPKESYHKIINSGNLFLKKRYLFIIIFIIALLLSLGLSHPQFLYNDEWISANQLAQIEQGHQIVVNEGKYGYYPNGTPSPYQSHNNLLGYSVILPVISLPMLKLIRIFGDTFDYWLMTVWSVLLIVLALLIRKFYPEIFVLKRISLSSFLIILAFVLFILNMVWYVPFTISPSDAPREAAAIILTNDLLFAGLCVVLFMIVRTLFQDRRFILLGTFICITSSSYLVWASSAKDHMLTIFLFGLMILGIVSFFYSKKATWCFLSFFFIGLLAWDRPEIGIFLLLFVFISLLPYGIREWRITKKKHTMGCMLISPVFTLIGAIPLFINDYIVTKNPLVTPYSLWSQPFSENQTLLNSSITSIGSAGVSGSPVSFFDTVFLWVTPHFDTLIQDFVRILFLPETGSIGIFILVPIFLVGVLSLPLLVNFKPRRFTTDELYLMVTLGLITISVFFAYISHFQTFNIDMGIVPDVRNLSPVYLALNIIGLIILSKFTYVVQNVRNLFNNVLIFSCLLVPIFIGLVSISKHKVESFFPIFSQVSLCISVLVIIIVLIIVIAHWANLKNYLGNRSLITLIGLLIVLPFIWQIITVFLIGNMVQAYEGYTFWLPIIRKISYTIYALI